MKRTIFISHANPEDNYFAAWLAAKLNVLGYSAWVDVEDFKTGDAFFTTIQPIIKEKAIRFIAVNSEAYIAKAQDQNTGVSRELNTAITVRDIENFILPIKVDTISFNDFPSHYASWSAIDFNDNWQAGLIELVRQFEKMGIEKNDQEVNPTETWFKAIKNENRILDKRERCFSNWLAFKFPKQIFIHYPESIEGNIYESIPFPLIPEANRIITFATEETAKNYISVRSSSRYEISTFLEPTDLEVDSSFTLIEPRKKLVRLLNQCFKYHLRKRELSYWRKRNLNYFQNDGQKDKSVSLKKRYGKGSRTLVGENAVKLNGVKRRINWHYAVSPRVDLNPFPHYTFYYTLVFTDERGKGLSKKHSRTLRRSIPADWYNRKWFELMLAAVLRLSDSPESEKLSIEISDGEYLEIDNLPIGGVIEKGYVEP